MYLFESEKLTYANMACHLLLNMALFQRDQASCIDLPESLKCFDQMRLKFFLNNIKVSLSKYFTK